MASNSLKRISKLEWMEYSWSTQHMLIAKKFISHGYSSTSFGFTKCQLSPVLTYMLANTKINYFKNSKYDFKINNIIYQYRAFFKQFFLKIVYVYASNYLSIYIYVEMLHTSSYMANVLISVPAGQSSSTVNCSSQDSKTSSREWLLQNEKLSWFTV